MHRATSLLTAVLLLAGCAATARPVTPANDEEFPPTGQVEALRLPFDAYSPSLAAMYTILNAEDRLTRDCMLAAGQDWKVIQRPTGVMDLRNRRRYGVIEMPIAQKFGYHVPTGLLTPAQVEELYDAREASLSQSQKDAVYGRDGCASKAARQIHTEESPPDGRLGELDRKSLNDSQREPHVAAALQSWRECVRQKGFSYQDPFAAISDSRWWADDAAGPSAEELAVAVADVQCKEETGLVEAWQAAEVPIQQDLIGKNAGYFEKLSGTLDRELAAARAVLARSDGR